MANKPVMMTIPGGKPLADHQKSITACADGPLPFERYELTEKRVRPNRARALPEEGSSAYGKPTITRKFAQRPRPGAMKLKTLTVNS